jgi:hypothetical protein
MCTSKLNNRSQAAKTLVWFVQCDLALNLGVTCHALYPPPPPPADGNGICQLKCIFLTWKPVARDKRKEKQPDEVIKSTVSSKTQ